MNFLSSICFGKLGNYRFLGIDVEFTSNAKVSFSFDGHIGLSPIRLLGYCATTCLNNKAFRLLSFGYLHTFVHEMGHALAHKILGSQSVYIKVDVSSCCGCTGGNSANGSKFREFIGVIAGPVTDMAFSSIQLVAAAALRSYVGAPVAGFVAGGAIMWMTGELFYAFYSTVNQDNGDFGRISRMGILPFAAATAALVGTFAFGIFQSLSFLSK